MFFLLLLCKMISGTNIVLRILLRKRAVIEFVNDFLKNVCQIEHSRHRNCCKFVVNLVSGIVAYSLLHKKPSIHLGIMRFHTKCYNFKKRA